MKLALNVLLSAVASLFRSKANVTEAVTDTPCVPVEQELQLAFRYARARLPIICTGHKTLGADASVLNGRKIAWVEANDMGICLHFEDESTFTVSIPQK
ncbi:hypothetical protein F2S72_09565 [Pseudomonas syringae pv. actinidiae]|nr:hypothetical protein [Pseudomonas syringae pv. actinidiae]